MQAARHHPVPPLHMNFSSQKLNQVVTNQTFQDFESLDVLVLLKYTTAPGQKNPTQTRKTGKSYIQEMLSNEVSEVSLSDFPNVKPDT
jgi:hypothetical protein